MIEQSVVSIPSLHGGISKQPPHLRFPNQVEDATNALFSVVDGVSKRPGTRFDRVVTGLTASGDYRLHPIRRDVGEQYILLYGDGDLKVFELTNRRQQARVDFDSAASQYLDANEATASDLRLITIADTTFIVNTKVIPRVKAAPEFTVTSRRRDYDVLRSQTPAQNTYHEAQADTEIQPAGHHKYSTGSATFATRVFAATDTTKGVPTWWTTAGNNNMGFKVAFRRQAITVTAGAWVAAAKTLTQVGKFTNYTHRAGDMVKVTGGTGVAAGWYAIASRDSANQITLVASIAGADNANTTATMIGMEVEVNEDFTIGTAPTTMDDVALRLQQVLQRTAANLALIGWTATAANNGYFTITGPYSGSDATVEATSAPAAATVNLSAATNPFNGGTAAAGTGPTPQLTEMEIDARWTRQPAPGQAEAVLDPMTMPVLLQRVQKSSALCSARFTCKQAEWSPRTSGDALTNPAPKFATLGKPIADLTYHRDRLGFAADERIAFSQAGDLLNFFAGDATNAVDSDPIDTPIAAEEVSIIDFLVPFRKSIVVFTKAGRQFELSAPEALTTKTAAFTPSTSYQTLSVRPRTIDPFLYFVAPTRDSASLFEYAYDDTAVASNAANVSAHVEGLLPASIRAIASHPNTGFVLVLGTNESKVYLYRAFWNGQQKEQSAWTRFEFDTGYRVCDVLVLDSRAWLLVESDSDFVLEWFALEKDADECCIADSAIPADDATCTQTNPGGGGPSAPTCAGSSLCTNGAQLLPDCFVDTALTIAGGTWNNSAKTLTKTGAFAAYTFASGDKVFITGGTGFVPYSWYSVASKVSADAITLASTVNIANTADVSATAIGDQNCGNGSLIGNPICTCPTEVPANCAGGAYAYVPTTSGGVGVTVNASFTGEIYYCHFDCTPFPYTYQRLVAHSISTGSLLTTTVGSATGFNATWDYVALQTISATASPSGCGANPYLVFPTSNNRLKVIVAWSGVTRSLAANIILIDAVPVGFTAASIDVEVNATSVVSCHLNYGGNQRYDILAEQPGAIQVSRSANGTPIGVTVSPITITRPFSPGGNGSCNSQLAETITGSASVHIGSVFACAGTIFTSPPSGGSLYGGIEV